MCELWPPVYCRKLQIFWINIQDLGKPCALQWAFKYSYKPCHWISYTVLITSTGISFYFTFSWWLGVESQSDAQLNEKYIKFDWNFLETATLCLLKSWNYVIYLFPRQGNCSHPYCSSNCLDTGWDLGFWAWCRILN